MKDNAIFEGIIGKDRVNQIADNKRQLCKEAAIALSGLGKTPSEIADTIGLSEARVRYLLKIS